MSELFKDNLKNPLLRINVVGVSGSGKSSFAKQLSEKLNCNYIQLDALYHEPNWAEAEVDVFRDRLSSALNTEQWVIDGNYHSKVHDLKWQNASTIIWLDLPFLQTLRQAITRAVKRAWNKEELWGTGNVESVRRSFFSRESVVLWTITSYHRVRRRYLAVKSDPEWAHIDFVHLRSHQQAAEFLQKLEG